MAERRKRLSRADVDYAWRRLSLLNIEIDQQSDDEQSLALARRKSLSFYDASYLELAQRTNFPLATRDRALTNAAKAEGVRLIGPDK